MTRSKRNTKGGVIIMEKNDRDAREQTSGVLNTLQQQRVSHYTFRVRDRVTLQHGGRSIKNFTPLNNR